MIEVERIVPGVNVIEKEEVYVIEVWLPGVAREMIEVIASDEEIVISGTKVQALVEERIYYQAEREFGNFRRVIRLPSPFNKKGIRAVMRDGVLRISVPKVKERREKYIRVEILEE